MSEALKHAQATVAHHMDEIAKLFRPGARVTVLVRFDNQPNLDFMMTAEPDINELAAMVERSKTRPVG